MVRLGPEGFGTVWPRGGLQKSVGVNTLHEPQPSLYGMDSCQSVPANAVSLVQPRPDLTPTGQCKDKIDKSDGGGYSGEAIPHKTQRTVTGGATCVVIFSPAIGKSRTVYMITATRPQFVVAGFILLSLAFCFQVAPMCQHLIELRGTFPRQVATSRKQLFDSVASVPVIVVRLFLVAFMSPLGAVGFSVRLSYWALNCKIVLDDSSGGIQF